MAIGDCHITNGQDHSRFKILSKFIVDQKPDYIVFMGDFLTLKCLSAWDKNKREKLEGLRYESEIEAGNLVMDIIFSDLIKYNKSRRLNKKKLYNPKRIFIKGNHEDRLARYLEIDPTFKGFVSIA